MFCFVSCSGEKRLPDTETSPVVYGTALRITLSWMTGRLHPHLFSCVQQTEPVSEAQRSGPAVIMDPLAEEHFTSHKVKQQTAFISVTFVMEPSGGPTSARGPDSAHGPHFGPPCFNGFQNTAERFEADLFKHLHHVTYHVFSIEAFI